MKTLRTTLLLILACAATASPLYAAGSSSKTCVVSGEPLGGDNGPPVEVSYKGQKVMLCCKSCVKKFNANPEKYMVQLDKHPSKQHGR